MPDEVDPVVPVVDPEVDPVDGSQDGVDDPPLRPEGEKALLAWKARAKAAEKAAQDAAAEAEALRLAQMTEQERAVAQATTEAVNAARAEAQGEANKRLFRAELRAAAATRMQEAALNDLLGNTDATLGWLGLTEFPVTAEGDLDSEAISQAVDAYVAARPYLASATPKPGNIDQGVRGTVTQVKSLEEQIAEAQAAGDWKLSASLKSQAFALSR